MTHLYRWAHELRGGERVNGMALPAELEADGFVDVSRYDADGRRVGDPRYGARLYRKLDAPLLHASARGEIGE